MFTYFLITGFIFGAAYGAYWLWRRRVDEDLSVGAQTDWDHLRQTQPDLLADLDEDRFGALYAKANLPRFPAYALAALGTFLAGTPIMLGLLNAGAYVSLRLGVVPQPGDAAVDLYFNADGASFVRRVSPEALSYILQGWSGFYLFFGLLIFWMGTVYVLMRRYHTRTPGTLKEEILRAR